MLFEFMKTAYTKYKTIFFICVIMWEVKGITTHLLEEIDKRVPENSTIESEDKYFFYEEDETVEHTNLGEEIEGKVKEYLFLMIKVSLLFGGILSDIYGGHWVIFVGLVIATFLTFVVHLSIFIDRIMLTEMIKLTKTVHIVIEVALFSLVGKIASPNQRTIFVSVIFASYFIGKLLFRIIKDNVVNVETLSEIAVFTHFVTATWWWMVFRRTQFPRVRKASRIPWRDILTSKSFYFTLLLLCSTYFYGRYFIKSITTYLKDLSSRLWPVYTTARINGLHFVPIFSYLVCGGATDFVISKRYLSSSKTRKCFVIMSIVLFSCTLLSSRYIHQSTDLLLGNLFAVKFTGPFMEATVVAISLELTPLCCGTFIVIYFIIYQIFIFATRFLVPEAYLLDDTHILEIFLFVLLTSLPFLCSKHEEKLWGTDPPPRSRTRTSTTTATEENPASDPRWDSGYPPSASSTIFHHGFNSWRRVLLETLYPASSGGRPTTLAVSS